MARLYLGPTQPPIKLVLMFLSPRLEGDHWPPYSAPHMPSWCAHGWHYIFYPFTLWKNVLWITQFSITGLGYMPDIQNALRGKSNKKHACVQVFTVQYSQNGTVVGDVPHRCPSCACLCMAWWQYACSMTMYAQYTLYAVTVHSIPTPKTGLFRWEEWFI